jgi:capsular exopolysaccharide synthesis family protein
MTTFARALRQAAQDAEPVGKNGSPLAEPIDKNGSLLVEPMPTPRWLGPASDIADDHLVSLISPAAFEAEQYRALRHVVEQMHKAASVSIIAVSSPAVGDGKTTTAINLAGALAQSPEARVLLIDADVRRPAIARLLGRVGTAPGLVDAILNPEHTFDELLQAWPQFNLSFIHAGHSAPRSPYELLKSARLGELLEEARQRFDYVIVDTPPLAAVQDCRLIARWVDGFLVVVAAHRTPRRLVEEALTVVEHAKILGLVFNADDDRAHIDHYGYAGAYFDARSSRPGRGAAWRVQAPKWAWRRRGASQ